MKRIKSKIASKIFSVLASTFLIVGCVPTSALADLSNIADNINDQAKVLNENGSNQAAANEDEDAALVEEPSDSNVAIESETQHHPQEAKQYTYRLIVEDPNFKQTIIRVEDIVLARYNNIVLLGFDNADQLEEAQAYYKDKSPIVSVDGAVGASSEDENLPDIDSTQSAEITKPQSAEDNPFAALEKTIKDEKEQEKAGVLENAAVRIQAMEVEETGQNEVDAKPLIALIDTGVYEDVAIKDRKSVVGGNGVDDNGHGTLMAQTIYEENAEAEILSIKALDESGHGSASAVYAAIELAIEKDAKIINCSFAGLANEGNSIIERAVRDALDHDVVVVAAAGNGGYDATHITPGNIEGVFTVGAADDGRIRETSNRGDVVDIYIDAESTSYAAARASGWIGNNFGDDWRELLVKEMDGVVGNDVVEAIGNEPENDSDGVEASVDTKVYWGMSGTTLYLANSSQPNCTKSCYPSGSGNPEWSISYGPTITTVNFLTPLAPQYTTFWFSRCSNLTTFVNFSNLDVSNVTTMLWMFKDCSSMTTPPDTSNWNTAKVTDMGYMFQGCSSMTTPPNTTNWNTEKVVGLYGIFSGCSSLRSPPDTSRWNTVKATSISSMFYGCSSLTTPPSTANWNTGSLISIDSMFYGCKSMTTVPSTADWNTAKLKYMSSVFYGCSKITTPPNTISWTTDLVTNMSSMFYGCSALTTPPSTTSWTTDAVTNMSSMFYGCSAMRSPPITDNWNTPVLTNMSFMFYGCTAMTTPPSTANWTTDLVTNMSSMFYGCSAMATSPSTGNWNTAAVTDMTSMFDGCSAITSLDISGWDCQAVTTNTNMLKNCAQISILKVGSNTRIADLPEHSASGNYLATWGNASQGIAGSTAANLVSVVNAGNGAGAWEWETLSKNITFQTGSTSMGTQSISGTANLTSVASMSNEPVSSSYGWSFYGWATSTGTTTYAYTDGQSITPSADMTLYAIYSRTVTFYYYSSASATSYSTDSRTQYYYNISDSAAGVGSVSTYALYTQSSYSWAPLGWVTSTSSTSASTSQTGSSTTIVSPGATAGRTYYALYSRTATLSYDANEGTGATPATTGTQKFVAGSGAQSLSLTLASNNFSRSGYGFSKWAAGSTSGTQYTEGGSFHWQNTSWTSSDSYTMYAIWAGNPYSVAFDNNGGSGSMTTQTGFTYGASQSLSSNEFSAPTASGGGWYFAGWATSQARASEGAIDYADAGNMTTGTTTSGDTVTLYAVWERNVEFKSGVAATTTTNITQLWNGSAGIAIISPTDTSAATISGWDKLGWRNDTTAGASDVSFNTSFSPDEAVYYAVYSRSATLSYQPGATSVTGSAPTSSVQTQYYNAYGNLSTLSATLANNTYTRDWFAFTSWDLGEAGDTYEWTPALNSSADIVATALWEEVVPTPTGLDPARSALPVSVAGTMLVAAAFIASRKKKQGKVRSVVRSLNDFETFHSKKN